MKSEKMVMVKVTKCPDQDDPWCTIPYTRDGLCLACKDRLLMNKCPRGETIENVTVTHHYECPHCGADLR